MRVLRVLNVGYKDIMSTRADVGPVNVNCDVSGCPSRFTCFARQLYEHDADANGCMTAFVVNIDATI